jgi:ankyrin repeat protein
MTEYNGDGGDYECPECGFMFGDLCDCGLPIEQDNQTIMDFCERNDLESLKTYLGNLCSIEGYLDFICSNETPLAEACFNGYYDIVELLIRKGADVNFADALDNTPLHRACEGCHLEIVKLLIDHGAEKYCKKKECKENAYGYTIEELANECDDPEKKAAIIELLK